ncbi:MAG: hypothetical protein ACYC5V_05815 [Gemmatimonadaceae bacterium]
MVLITSEILYDVPREIPDDISRAATANDRAIGGTKMFSGEEIAALFTEMGVTHVVSIADSTIGPWHPAIEASPNLRLVRVCREGEAWAVAAGLYLGGATPLVLIQCTGLFESGDSLRNILHDWKLPIFSVIGYRSYLNQSTLPGDTCLVFTEPLLDAWRISYRLITTAAQRDEILAHYIACRDAGQCGAALIAEGKA